MQVSALPRIPTSPNGEPQSEIWIQKVSARNSGDALELIEEYYEEIGVIARDSRESVMQYVADPRSAIWVAYTGPRPVGCILYRPLTDPANSGEMKRLYVRAAHRSKGIASRLLLALEEFSQAQKADWIYLDTKDDLKSAIVFYERHGYARCERYNDNPQATIFMRKRLQHPVTVRCFEQGDEAAFQLLNEAWIKKFFRLEEKDHNILGNPSECILAPGGQIFLALRKGERVGCCALVRMDNRSFEVSKMAVAETEQGQGIGRRLLEYVIAYARAKGIGRLYLETNHALLNAIHLYESVGFRHLPPERVQASPYVRADVYMEMILSD
jgi:putative acetyltransferase